MIQALYQKSKENQTISINLSPIRNRRSVGLSVNSVDHKDFIE